MKILFDLISIQGYHSGGGEYVKIVFQKLLSNESNSIFGLYDSHLPFLGRDLDDISTRVQLLDVQNKDIYEYIRTYEIDTFFIGIVQRYIRYNLQNKECKIICVIHDVGDLEIVNNNIHYLYPYSLKNYMRMSIDYWLRNTKYSTPNRVKAQYQKIEPLLLQDNVTLITVSKYTRNSLLYFFTKLEKKQINVLYPPGKKYILDKNVSKENLTNIFSQKKKYLLFLNANRENKNFNILLRSWNVIKKRFPDMLLIVTGSKGELSDKDIISFDYVSNSDVEYLYMNAWALIYSSYTEGFGYPPIEAMKYSTPVISSNVCSMPEILGDAALYFSPLYENDLFCKVECLSENYHYYKMKSREQYQKIALKQVQDFDKLINGIIDGFS